MADIIIRAGGHADARQACELLNEIIHIGGTTAFVDPLQIDGFLDWIQSAGGTWHVAETDEGQLLGFQWIGALGELPKTRCAIATFVKAGLTGQGVGSRLFERTKPAARALGFDWIEAEIRADNTGGIIYYQNIGFREYHSHTGALSNGTPIEKVTRIYDLSEN